MDKEFPMQVCRSPMGASGIDFQTHKTFSANLCFAECTSLKCKNGGFSALPQNCGKSRKLWKSFGGKAERYFIINLLRILRLFLIAVVGRPLSARWLMFFGIYARTQVSEWMSSSILPEPLRKRDVDKNGLDKVHLKS